MMYFEHALVALAVQAIVGLLTGRWWTGAALASGYFIGREAAQAEYRWIEVYGAGLRANMPWWAVFDGRVWPKLDQTIDWLGPVLATCGLAAFVSRK
ncbi:hypothetical protein HNO88_003914 [Novosphingobium chloroacetimidivorans]|uniref:Uncharacterized protein n=1 Tax=Novosphingobium chloroacetimidivorans TaxID=1428314 RepID=A0A7W7NYU5_9SPHN|nr:hypothetical protein [Novosphingobium chloroacetimidivorans]MBB4860570.1 hypothetical protein [Novosphingobium chloroacetimidivorans]